MSSAAFNITGSGSALALQSASTRSVFSTLCYGVVYCALSFVVFLFLRRKYPNIYHPRTYLGTLRQQDRTPGRDTDSWFKWMKEYYNTPDLAVLDTHTMDGYLFLRLLKTASISCIVGIIFIWPILLPINITGSGEQTNLSRFTLANAAGPDYPGSYNRYYAHVFCAYLYFGFIMFMILRETIFYINLRQAYLGSPLYKNRVSSRTVLFTATPEEYLDPHALRRLFGEDIVRNIWIPRKVDQLVDAVTKRDELAMKLEKAEIAFIKKCLKSQKKSKQEDLVEGSRGDLPQHIEAMDHNRPKHKTGFLGLFGEKVDTIEWCREELSKSISEVQEHQRYYKGGLGEPMGSVFVEFETLSDAQAAYQTLTHREPQHMAARYIGVSPSEIIWPNLGMKMSESIVRFLVTTSFWVGLIVCWGFPTAAISSISIGQPGLNWQKLSDKSEEPGQRMTEFVTGLVSSLLLSILMALLPPVLRLTHKLRGEPTRSAVEYALQNSYFWFYLIQVFLVTTLSNGLFGAAWQISQDPRQALTIVAKSLPAASNFYLAFIAVQGLGVVANTLGSFYYLFGWLFVKLINGTPRAMYKSWVSLYDPGMGAKFPVYTTMFIIAIAYSCIAPFVLAFAAIGLFFFYLAFRYQFLYVYNVPQDTKGLMYARALQQLFVGLYLAELCLIGLFSLAIPKSLAAIGPMALMIILLLLTIMCHVSINRVFEPLRNYLPKALEIEEETLLAAEMEEGREATVRDAQDAHEGTLRRLKHWQKRYQNKKENPGFLRRWFRPSVYQDYYTLRKLVPRDFEKPEYAEDVKAEDYTHPAITSPPPTLWIPRDSLGLSKRECEETSKVIPMSDDCASFVKGDKIVWDEERADEVPVATTKIYW